MCKISTAGLKIADKQADIMSSNVLVMQNPELSVKDLKTSAIITGDAITGMRSVVVRKVDLMQLGTLREYTSQAENAKQISDSLSIITDHLSTIDESARPALAQEVSEFLSSISAAANAPSNSTHKRICVDQANNLAQVISKTSGLCYEKKWHAYNGITEELDHLNQHLQDLASTNQQLRAQRDDSDKSFLEDQRDILINNISSLIGIDTPKYAKDGSVTVSTGGYVMVESTNRYARFVVPTLAQQEIELGADIPDVYMRYENAQSFDKTPQPTQICSKIFTKASESGYFGRISGLFDLYNEKIPRLIESLDALAVNVAQKVNAVHNSGSCFGGRKEIVGSTLTSSTDAFDWKGNVSIGLVDANGRNLKTGSGMESFNIPPLKLNLDKLSEVSDGNKVSVGAILNEINSHFQFTNKTVIAMGPQADNIYKNLVQDISMVVSTSQKGQLRFDFAAFNNSEFAADFEILEVQNPDGSFVEGNLPDKFILQAGDKARTFQNITLNKNTLTGMQDIDIKFRVKGSNGAFGEGVLRFAVDFDSIIPAGTRIPGSLVGGASDGDFTQITVDTSVKISADITRPDGSKIINGEKGVLCIRKNSNEAYGIVMQDEDSSTNVKLDGFSSTTRGFGHFFGMNNLFSLEETKGQYGLHFGIRQDIFKNESLFSSGRMQKTSAKTENRLIGVGNADATVNFAAFGGAINLASYHNANVSIGTKTYNLVNTPLATTDQISIDGLTSEQEIIDRVVAFLNTDKYCNNFVEFTANTGSITMKSQIVGTNGNNISFRFASAGDNIFNGVADTNTLNFAGGSDVISAVALGSSSIIMPSSYGKLYEDFVKLEHNSNFITSENINITGNGLSSYATNILDRILSVQESAYSDTKIKTATLQYFALDYQEKYGFDPNQHALDLSNLVLYKNTLVQTMAKIQEMQKMLLNALAR